jgi:NADPH-dependent 2,4-dienoyl-CoA reductase/sulfur reductase-like enzyme
MGGLNHAAFARAFHRHNVRVTINTRLVSVRRQGNTLVAVLGSDYGAAQVERIVDQVVVDHGTLPDETLYEALKPHSVNLGAVDYEALVAGRPQDGIRNPDGTFRLFRIGDAVSSRNIHAAIYDALRLAKDL